MKTSDIKFIHNTELRDPRVHEILNKPSNAILRIGILVNVFTVGGILALMLLIKIPLVKRFPFQLLIRENTIEPTTIIIPQEDARSLYQNVIMSLQFSNQEYSESEKCSVISIDMTPEKYAKVRVKLMKITRRRDVQMISGFGTVDLPSATLFQFFNSKRSNYSNHG